MLAWPLCCVLDDGNQRVVEASRYYGTATPLVGSFLVTAHHVVEGAREAAEKSGSQPALVLPRTRTRFRSIPFKVLLSLPDTDLALLTVEADIDDPQKLLPPVTANAIAGTPVSSAGFPHVSGPALFYRLHRGHIVSRTYKTSDDTYSALRDGVRIYELSYRVPKGLSGAAVMDETGMIVGVVVGEHQTEVDVRMTESVQDGVERYESIARHFIAYGLAVDFRELLEANHEGKTVRSLLLDAGLKESEHHALLSSDVPPPHGDD